ncbi:Predicted dehydrogenase [Actinopolymorpha cephalotaxi]|uniref:Dehydrogenase n=1 Tax=Actinopolymorpha cephalotaxi TaxID=504797 RepID=A0A1I2THP7_9ACTN|nr:Gfo/Idh/MocA family oxidoreductase [Actinopolymorpha cephalotaxi]NYH83096.1 putative dehydrogenase [Actinopolymorpha cephalotaxi]SFG64462.1 Predicted dehydrogenase [Actinopolymorpha cephalotaxi]
MIRIAMLSFWHVHALGYARQAQEHPGTEIVAAWDEDPARGRAEADKLGVPFHENLADVLARDDVDAVIVDTPTNIHPEVISAAARAGKHIFTEKVLALTVRECNEILAEVDKAGVTLILSLPRLYHGYTQAIREVLESGHLGELALVRTRLSHGGAVGEGWLPEHFYDPEQCGGGALVDLGCHPMYLTRLFLGAMPESVSASYGHVTGRQVEDNAVAVLRYPNGAIGVVEAGFATTYSPFSIEIHGTKGSLLFGTPDQKLLVRSPGHEGGEKWVELPVPGDQPDAFDQWVEHIGQGTRPTANVEMGVDLTRLMEAANHSVAVDGPVRIDSVTG